MTNLQEMLQSVRLADIEKELQDQISLLEADGFDVKLAILLSIMAEESLKRLESIDTTDFPKKLEQRIEELRKRHVEKLDTFKVHRVENAAIMKQLDAAATELPEIDRQVTGLLGRYDELLKQHVFERDTKPIGSL